AAQPQHRSDTSAPHPEPRHDTPPPIAPQPTTVTFTKADGALVVGARRGVARWVVGGRVLRQVVGVAVVPLGGEADLAHVLLVPVRPVLRLGGTSSAGAASRREQRTGPARHRGDGENGNQRGSHASLLVAVDDSKRR